jgi:hypothetical protein
LDDVGVVRVMDKDVVVDDAAVDDVVDVGVMDETG